MVNQVEEKWNLIRKELKAVVRGVIVYFQLIVELAGPNGGNLELFSTFEKS